MIIPDARQAIEALLAAVCKGGLPEATGNLVHLRASQINGCNACVDGGARTAQKAGESTERLFAVAAWCEAPYFTDGERAALRSPKLSLASVTAPTRCPTRYGRRRPSTTPSMIARLFGRTRQEAAASADAVLAQLELTDVAGRLVKTYSGGLRRRLDLGASMVGASELGRLQALLSGY
jgi:AhpD family alkylhydroperoxidase